MSNDIRFLCAIVTRLENVGIKTLVFGGWAEELTNVIAPRPHNDVDLFYLADDFVLFDRFLSTEADFSEIELKHFSHKRAFVYKGVMIELMLLQKEGNKLITNFWNEYKLEWPDFFPMTITLPSIGDILVVPPPVTDFYRKHYEVIDAVRNRHIVGGIR